MKIFQSLPVTEWQTKVARGETVGFNSKMDQAPDGAAENQSVNHFFRPIRGLIRLFVLPTVSPRATFFRAAGALMAMFFLFVAGATAETTNDLSAAEIQGRDLAQQLLEQTPASNFTQNGVFNIRDRKGSRSEIPVRFQTSVATTAWSTTYEIISESNHVSLIVIHEAGKANQYEIYNGPPLALALPKFLTGNETMFSFAKSDFWIADLGLEFLHWPEQKILKKEVKRSRGCSVLESTNPNPSTNSYSRVVSWIDNDGGGIVQAFAYDAQGKLLKEFYPKNIEKVNGQYQVQEMDVINDQTGSRTRLEFDLNKK
jgi:YD repeat-containing protein